MALYAPRAPADPSLPSPPHNKPRLGSFPPPTTLEKHLQRALVSLIRGLQHPFSLAPSTGLHLSLLPPSFCRAFTRPRSFITTTMFSSPTIKRSRDEDEQGSAKRTRVQHLLSLSRATSPSSSSWAGLSRQLIKLTPLFSCRSTAGSTSRSSSSLLSSSPTSTNTNSSSRRTRALRCQWIRTWAWRWRGRDSSSLYSSREASLRQIFPTLRTSGTPRLAWLINVRFQRARESSRS